MGGVSVEGYFLFWLFKLFNLLDWGIRFEGFGPGVLEWFFLFYYAFKVLSRDLMNFLLTFMSTLLSDPFALILLLTRIFNNFIFPFENFFQLPNIRIRLKYMAVSVGFRKGSDSSLMFILLIWLIIGTILGNGLIHNGILFLERLLSNGIDLLKFFLLYVVFLVTFYDMVYVGYCVFDNAGHDVDRAQVVDLWAFVHFGFLWVAVLLHDL